MNMVDMKLPKKTEKEMKAECMPCGSTADQPRYPYGLEVRLDEDSIDKIPGASEYNVGDKIMLIAEMCVTSKSASERQGGKPRCSVSMQIEKMSCEPKIEKKPEDMNPKEYRKAREAKQV